MENKRTRVIADEMNDLLQRWRNHQINIIMGEPSYDPPLVYEMRSAIERYATKGSNYLAESRRELRELGPVLEALRNDYASGRMLHIGELIHLDLFTDFLDAAEHLLREGYKGPAAVMAGGVLEGHLKNLAEKNGIELSIDNKPKKAETLNQELAKQDAGAYDKTEMKQVTAWLGIRNDAAHNDYEKFDEKQVELMCEGIRAFIARHPA